MLKRLLGLGLLAVISLLVMAGRPDLTGPEYGFVFLIAVACVANWLLRKVPGHYPSPRCPSCGRNLRS